MIRDMRRLHPRGAATKGICVDVEGATLGPGCMLVRRTSSGYYAVDRREAIAIQKSTFGGTDDTDWLFRQCQHIADALNRNEVALAQIFGLRIAVRDFDDLQQEFVANTRFVKAGFNPNEPRIPRGDPHGGEWTTGGPQDQDQQLADVPLNRNKDDCIRYCFEQTSMLRDLGATRSGRV